MSIQEGLLTESTMTDLQPKIPGGSKMDNNQSQNTQGRTMIPDISTLVSRVVTQNALSVEGAKYIENISQGLANVPELKSIGTPEVFALANMPGVEIVALENMAIVLVMYEVVEKHGDAAVSSCVIRAKDELHKQTNGKYTIYSVISVHPADYAKSSNMVSHLANTFINLTNKDFQGITLRNFAPEINRGSYVVEFVRNSAGTPDSNSPHAVPVRKDVTIQLKLRTDGGSYASDLNNLTGGGVGKLDYTDTLIVSVDTYTTFVKDTVQDPATNSLVPKFLPLIHISNIYSALPVKYSVPIAAALVSYALIDNSAEPWKQQFFDLTNNSFNLGELFVDEKGQPYTSKTTKDVEAIFANHMLPAFVVLDVAQGRASVPGLNEFVASTADESLVLSQDMNRFFETNEFSGTDYITRLAYAEEIGYSTWNNNMLTDTRVWDYLHTVHGRSTTPRLENLLSLMKSTTNTIGVLREVAGIETASLYHNEWAVFSAATLALMTRHVVSALRLPMMGVEERALSPSFITAEANRYHANANNISGVAYNTFGMNHYLR